VSVLSKAEIEGQGIFVFGKKSQNRKERRRVCCEKAGRGRAAKTFGSRLGGAVLKERFGGQPVGCARLERQEFNGDAVYDSKADFPMGAAEKAQCATAKVPLESKATSVRLLTKSRARFFIFRDRDFPASVSARRDSEQRAKEATRRAGKRKD